MTTRDEHFEALKHGTNMQTLLTAARQGNAVSIEAVEAAIDETVDYICDPDDDSDDDDVPHDDGSETPERSSIDKPPRKDEADSLKSSAPRSHAPPIVDAPPPANERGGKNPGPFTPHRRPTTGL